MRKTIRKPLALLLAVIMLSGCFVCFASALDSDKQYRRYENFVLLGDSSVSGFEDNGPETGDFVRVEGSFAAIVADTLGVENFYPRACRGFRTVEYRYMFEDDFTADEWLFAHTDYDYAMSMRYQLRDEVAKADIIAMGVGGNDFGAYVGWLIDDMLEKEGANDEFVAAVREYVAGTEYETNDFINGLLDFAETAGHLEEMIAVLPEAVVYTVSGYIKNWDILIQDIYNLNPDVELYVMGIFNNNYPENPDNLTAKEKASVEIQDLLVEVANKPMTDGAKKFGYTFVETNGVLCDVAHATPEGHKFMAEKLLEALPDARFPSFEDVNFNTTCFQGVYYMYMNGLMDSESDSLFGVDANFTKAEFSAVLNKLDSKNAVTDSDKKLTYGNMALTLFGMGLKKDGLVAKVRSFVMLANIISACNFNLTETVTKGTAAEYIYDYIKL